jgi:tetratricopeptide (TPR) repeat protein
MHEADGDLLAAAEAWQGLGDIQRAVAAWEKAGAFEPGARALSDAGEHGRAGELFERAKLLPEAAASMQNAGRPERAADLWLKAGDVRRAVTLYRKAGVEEKLLRCYRQLGDYESLGAHWESRGEVRRAVQEYARAFGGSEEARERLFSSLSREPTTTTTIRHAAVLSAALSRHREAAAFFRRAGLFGEAAQELEEERDFLGSAECLALDGRWLDAARTLEKSDLGAEGMTDAIQQMLRSHLSRNGEPDQRALQELQDEAAGLRDQGRLAPALARFFLLGDDAQAAELSLRLGLHEKAISWFLETGKPLTALKYARADGFSVSAGFVEELVRTCWVDSKPPAEDEPRMRELFAALLRIGLRGTDPASAREMVETWFDRAWDPDFSGKELPREAHDLLLEHPVPNVIIRALLPATGPGGSLSEEEKRFVAELARQGEEQGDPMLSACAAWVTDPAEFETVVAAMPAESRTACLLASSAARYREGVSVLMAGERIEEALLYCRLHRDPGLAARCAEECGALEEAARFHVEAGDLEAALRCCRAAGDEAGAARVLEKMGRWHDALSVWRTLGRDRDVARVIRKTGSG